MTSLLDMEGVSKAFLGVPVLTDVSHHAAGRRSARHRGRERGRQVDAHEDPGRHPPGRTAGAIRLEASPSSPHTPRDALAAGIKVVHQELSLFPDRTVAENIFAGVLPTTPRHDPGAPAGARRGRGAEAGRARGRAGDTGARPVAGATATRRDRPRAVAEGADHRHGRADRDADEPRGRVPDEHHRGAQGGRRRHHLHQPPPRGGLRHLRPRRP